MPNLTAISSLRLRSRNLLCFYCFGFGHCWIVVMLNLKIFSFLPLRCRKLLRLLMFWFRALLYRCHVEYQHLFVTAVDGTKSIWLLLFQFPPLRSDPHVKFSRSFRLCRWALEIHLAFIVLVSVFKIWYSCAALKIFSSLPLRSRNLLWLLMF